MLTAERKTLISKIHIGKNQLQLDDESYRGLLARVTGKTSCTQLNEKALKAVLAELKRLGFLPRSRKFAPRPSPAPKKELYLNKITALLCQRNLPPSYADAIAKQAFKVDFVHWLNVEQLKKVIQMLEVALRRNKL